MTSIHELGGDRQSASRRAWGAAREYLVSTRLGPVKIGEVATHFGIGLRILQEAIQVHRQGVPELLTMLDEGWVRMNAASLVARLTAAEQRRVVAKGPDAVKQRAAELRRGRRAGQNAPAAGKPRKPAFVHPRLLELTSEDSPADCWRDVVDRGNRCSVECGDALALLRSMPTDSVDLVFTSPPYSSARTYGIGADRTSAVWVEWMRPIVVEACRVSKTLAIFNVSDVVEGFRYQNAPEWLHADLTRLDGLVAIRPYIWVKSGPEFDDRGNGSPGSGGAHFHRNDYEPIYGYALPGKLGPGRPPHWSNNRAFGEPPKFGPGGPTSNRNQNGVRKTMTPRRGGGEREVQAYKPPAVSNPGNVLRVRVGGFNLGGALAHDSEAPMALGVAERMICWFAPPSTGIVCDPFLGSGTTAVASLKHGRKFCGNDIRAEQVELARQRISDQLLQAAHSPPASCERYGG